MKIIIEIKESAKLERIAALGERLEDMKKFEVLDSLGGFPDVIEDINKEW